MSTLNLCSWEIQTNSESPYLEVLCVSNILMKWSEEGWVFYHADEIIFFMHSQCHLLNIVYAVFSHHRSSLCELKFRGRSRYHTALRQYWQDKKWDHNMTAKPQLCTYWHTKVTRRVWDFWLTFRASKKSREMGTSAEALRMTAWRVLLCWAKKGRLLL